MSPDPVKNKPPAYRPPAGNEPQRWNLRVILFWLFVIAGVGAIVWMVKSAWQPTKLVCDAGAPTSLIGFGSCHEE